VQRQHRRQPQANIQPGSGVVAAAFNERQRDALHQRKSGDREQQQALDPAGGRTRITFESGYQPGGPVQDR
jgi:hypothetical protein